MSIQLEEGGEEFSLLVGALSVVAALVPAADVFSEADDAADSFALDSLALASAFASLSEAAVLPLDFADAEFPAFSARKSVT